MTRILILLLIVAALAAAAPVQAQGSAAVTTQEAQKTADTSDLYGLRLIGDLEFYATVQKEDMDWVREYDGRRYRFVDIGTLRLNWFTPGIWGNFLARDIASNNPDAFLWTNIEDIVSLRGRFQRITHRLAPWPLISPTMPGNTFTSLTPNSGFRTDRDLGEVRVGITPPGLRWLRLAGEFWSLDQEGSQQLLFRSRSNRLRFQASQPVDRTTTETRLGVDLGTWADAFNYRHVERRFSEHAAPPTYPQADTLVPIKVIVPDTKTDGNTFTLRNDITNLMSRIDRNGQGSWFTGYFSSKSRRNLSARTSIRTAEEPVRSATLPDDPNVKVRLHNMSLTHMHGHYLMLTTRYRHLNYDNRTPFLESGGEPLNQVVRKRYSSFGVDATYTGIRRLTLLGGYEYRIDRRNVEPIHEVHPEFSHGPIATSSAHNLWNLSGVLRPANWATLRVKGRFESIHRHIFAGTPSTRFDTDTDLTVNIGPSLIFLANYSFWREKNTAIPPPGPIPLDDPNFALIRDQQSGAGYNSLIRTWDMALWGAPKPWVTAEVHAGRYDVRSRVYWILGTDNTFLPIIETPELVPYRVRNLYLSGSATFRVTPRLKLRANLMHSDSRGQTVSYSLFSKVPDPAARVTTISPVNVRSSRDTVGAEYQFSRSTRLLVEYSWNNWSDRINPANDGKFQLLSVGVWVDF